MANFSNYAFKLHTTGMSAVLFGGVTNLGHILNTQAMSPETGHAYKESQSIVGQRPEIPITSECLSTIITNIGLTGKCITSGVNPGLVAYMQRHDPCVVGARASATNMSVTMGNGHLFIENIEAGGIGSNVAVQLRAHGTSSDGATNPVVVAYNVTLPSSPIVEQFALGKPTILGTVLHKIQSLSVAYNVNFDKPNDADTIWPSEIDPSNFNIQISIVGRFPELLGVSLPSVGQHTDDDTIIRFIKRATNATEMANASNGGLYDFTDAAHIEGAITGLVHVDQHYDAGGAATGLTRVTIDGFSTGGVAPIVWDAAAQYNLS